MIAEFIGCLFRFLHGSGGGASVGTVRLSLSPNRGVDVLLIDLSGSMNFDDYRPTRLGGAVQAVSEFIRLKREATPEAMLGVATFSFSGQELVSPKPVKNVTPNEMTMLTQLHPYGGTNQNAGLVTGWEMLRRVGASEGSRIILLTDGWATIGCDGMETARQLKTAGVQLDIVGIGGSPSEVNEEQLRSMASEVGGKVRYWFIDSAPKLVEHYRKLSLMPVR